jgi:hypothetical protein
MNDQRHRLHCSFAVHNSACRSFRMISSHTTSHRAAVAVLGRRHAKPRRQNITQEEGPEVSHRGQLNSLNWP